MPSSNSYIAMVFYKTKIVAIDIEAKVKIHEIEASLANVFIIDNYIYSMQNEKSYSKSGLFIQSLNTFWDEKTRKINTSKAFKLSSAIGGQSNQLMYIED
jgi:hypothetical protein